MGETEPMQPMAMGPPTTRRKGGIAIGIGVALIVLGVVGGIFGVIAGARNLQDRIDELQRVPISQGGDLQLAEAGTYKVFLERPEAPSGGVPVRITGPEGNALTLSTNGTSENYDIGGRHGLLLGSFRAPQPGSYRFAVTGYSGEPGAAGSGQLAVGKRSPVGALVGILGGVFGGIAAGVVGIILIIVGAVRRSRSKRPPMGGFAQQGWGAPAGPAGWAPPPGQAWAPPAAPGWTPPPQPGPPPPPPPPPAGAAPAAPASPPWTPPQTGGNTTWNPPSS